ncbi:hypothetical protein [Paenibacillus polymyxa]|uniref:hypothetical protein n=1 Tax=Paenibacillus polymyxa TaxID=1406 RepID=UPI002AB4AD08|nr:hypothetical protein [Paenibacillus polymyxa]MDY8025611.1 hypothetical protein [Paenibacillus polymyxa]
MPAQNSAFLHTLAASPLHFAQQASLRDFRLSLLFARTHRFPLSFRFPASCTSVLQLLAISQTKYKEKVEHKPEPVAYSIFVPTFLSVLIFPFPLMA